MHKRTRSDPPANFYVAAGGSDLSELLPDPRLEAIRHGRDRPPTASQKRWKPSHTPNYLDDASVWWGSWVPVAATGWGALFIIVPLVVTDFLIWATGGRRGRHPT